CQYIAPKERLQPQQEKKADCCGSEEENCSHFYQPDHGIPPVLFKRSNGRCATRRYPQRSRQASNISTSQIRYFQLSRPLRCSLHASRTAATLKSPPPRSRFSESRSPAQLRSGPRSHSPSGIAKPVFGRSTGTRVTCRESTWSNGDLLMPSRMSVGLGIRQANSTTR